MISLDEISNVDMIILHNIVLYSDDIPKEKLDVILKSLLDKKDLIMIIMNFTN